jgi:hypothetical protein
MNENFDEDVLVDEAGELWRYYGTTHGGVRIYEPVRLVMDDSRDSKPEAELAHAKKIGQLPAMTHPLQFEMGSDPTLGYDAYYFTFGLGSKLVAFNSERPLEPEQEGFPLGNKYVVIHAADQEAARDIMRKHFGLNAWAASYDSQRWISSPMRLSHTLLVELFQEKSISQLAAEEPDSTYDDDDLEEQYCSSDEPHPSHVWGKTNLCPGE